MLRWLSVIDDGELMGLDDVLDFMKRGEYKHALDLLISIPTVDQVSKKLMETELLIENGDLNEAVHHSKSILDDYKSILTPNQNLKALINLCWVYKKLGAINELENALKQLEEFSFQDLDDNNN